MLQEVVQALAWVAALSCRRMRSKVDQEGRAQREVAARLYAWAQGLRDSHSTAGWQVDRQKEAVRAFGSRAMARHDILLVLAWACLRQCWGNSERIEHMQRHTRGLELTYRAVCLPIHLLPAPPVRVRFP